MKIYALDGKDNYIYIWLRSRVTYRYAYVGYYFRNSIVFSWKFNCYQKPKSLIILQYSYVIST